jgi:His-Xaa-Ser system protein HxsD
MDNFEIKDGSVIVSVNPKIYPLDVIFSAAYIFTDKNYIILDGNPEEEILVEIKPKEKNSDIGKIAMEFNNELISYGSYAVQLANNSHLRALILHRVLQTAGRHHHNQTNPEVSNLDNSKPWKKELKENEEISG